MILGKPKSFFYQTLSAITLVSIGFQLIVLSALAYYMLIPLGQRATDDLSSVIIYAAERWDKFKPQERQEFAQQMLLKHKLVLTSDISTLPVSTSLLPYIHLLKQSLNQYQETPITIKESTDKQGEVWFWVDIKTSNTIVRFGFSRSRIGVNPPVAFFITLIIGIVVVLITAILLTRRLSKPIDKLYRASQLIGKGHWPDPINEQGTTELATLTKQFNKMSLQVKELLSNRTTLLAGIAHDLRTPLTQIQLALAMLPNNGGDIDMMKSIQQDLDEINNLINETLSIGLELTVEKQQQTHIEIILAEVVNHLPSNPSKITINYRNKAKNCSVLYPLALKRILKNLLTNAIRYGKKQPIDIVCDCVGKKISISIKDNGMGIPKQYSEKVFQPFYRLEKSRNSETGGSGLGLAIVQQLATTHGWKIKLKPRDKQGTNAILSIPCEFIKEISDYDEV